MIVSEAPHTDDFDLLGGPPVDWVVLIGQHPPVIQGGSKHLWVLPIPIDGAILGLRLRLPHTEHSPRTVGRLLELVPYEGPTIAPT